MEIATLEIVLRTDRAKRGAKSVRNELDRVGRTAGKTAQKTVAATATMTTAFARLRAAIFSTQSLLLSLGIGIGLVAAISTLKEFEFTMAGVKAISGATADEFLLLSDSARRLGATTIFAASEAAEGLRLLSLAGFQTAESLAAIEGTLALATAGSLGLGEASQITANIVRSFRIEASKAGEIADVLAKTATNANISVGGLGNSFSFVGAVARAANQSVADTAAALGVLADAGFDSSRAGTGLRRVMGEILVQNKKLLARLPELGLTFDDINLQTNSLVDVLGKLAPLASDAAFALETFGQRGGPAFLALVGQADRLDALAEKTRDAGGAALEIAAILTDTLAGSLKLLRSALEEATLQAEFFAKGIRKTADTVRGIITVFNGQAETLGENAERFENLAEKVRIFARFLLGLAILPMAKAIIFLTAAVKGLTLALLKNPFALWSIAIGSLVALFFKMRNDVLDFGTEAFSVGSLLNEVWTQMKFLVADVTLAIVDLINEIKGVGTASETDLEGVFAAALLTAVDLIDQSIKGLRALAIVIRDLPNIIRNFGEMSDEAFAKLQALEDTKPIGERAAANFAKGFTEGLDEKALALLKVGLKSVDKQAARLVQQLESLTKLDLDLAQEKELRLLTVVGEEAAGAVGKLTAEIVKLGGFDALSNEQIVAFNDRLVTLQSNLTAASGDVNTFLGSVQQAPPAAGDAAEVIEKLNDQLKILAIFGEKDQFVLQALTEAELDNADASDQTRRKVEALAQAVFEATQRQDAYKFAIEATGKPLDDLQNRLLQLRILYDQEKLTLDEFNTATGLTKLEMEGLNAEMTRNAILAQGANAGLSNFQQGILAVSTQIGFTRENLMALGEQAATTLGGALTEALKRPKDAADIFLNALASIGDKIIELAAQELLLRPLLDTLSGISSGGVSKGGAGGGGIGGLLGGLGGLIGAFFSQGGISHQPERVGVLPAAAFANARRFQMGGAVDRIPALLARNEAVVPLPGGRAIPVDFGEGGGRRGPQVVINVTTPDAESFKRSQNQILSTAEAQLRTASERNN